MGSRTHRARVPWLGWGAAEVATGSLAINSSVKVDLLGASGLTLIPPAPAPIPSVNAGPATKSYSSEYQVNDPTRLGEIRWDPPPRASP